VSDAGRLFFRSLLSLKVRGREYLIWLDLPLEGRLVSHIAERTSINTRFLDPSDFDSPSKAMSDLFSTGGLSRVRWGHILEPTSWESQVNPVSVFHGVALEVPLVALFQHFFTQSAGFGSLIVIILGSLGSVFVLVEIISVLIGIAIARSITRSIHNIDEGARNIEAGNLDYRIPSRNKDQLDTMAQAFNRMSESVVHLMNQVSEKERLEKEIEIAREVQTHLFPRELPETKRLQLSGSCLPARRVSGDYYDFIPYGEESLDVIIADISGKGISAALLMASLQSSIRSHLAYQSVSRNGQRPVAEAVHAINRQLYTHTSPDKFATMVFSRIDTQALTLTYCNAGHNPPLLLAGGNITRLSKGGIVAGLFEDPQYEQETIQLETGDLVLFYTDGVVEAENPQGDQFEQEKLEDLLRSNAFLTADDIKSLILEEVSNWVRGQEQSDDITVVTVKVEKEGI
jgi:sigma-B regulation protein RsbU (phosphoserine phosphatase)